MNIKMRKKTTKQGDIEMEVMSCILCNPKLITKVMDIDFEKLVYKKMWALLFSTFNKYGTVSVPLVCSQVDEHSKLKVLDSLSSLLANHEGEEPFGETYVKRLKEIIVENEKNARMIYEIFAKSNDLLCGNLDLDHFFCYIAEKSKEYEEFEK